MYRWVLIWLKEALFKTHHFRQSVILLYVYCICNILYCLYPDRYDVEVQDFGKSWRSGLAFLALIKSINPAIVDMRAAISKTPQENVEDAFLIAQSILGIPSLLDVEGKLMHA